MFKMAKYYMFLKLYRDAKRNVLLVLLSIILFIVSVFVFADLMAMAQGNEKYTFLMSKWVLLLSILAAIVWNTKVALKKIRHPFSKGNKHMVKDVRKEKLLAKERLQSKQDLILKKYRNTK